MKNSRIVTEGMKHPVHVIHEGLNNYPELKEELAKIAKELTELASDECGSHLSDVACFMSFRIDQMKELAKKIFSQHEIEQVEGLPIS